MAERVQHVGIVTVTYNSAEVIEPFMRSVLAQAHRLFTLIIIDNASRDDTLMRVSAFDDERIVVIANQENVGIAAGNNQGIHVCRTRELDAVLLINNDTEFPPELLGKMLETMASRQCDMLVPKMYFFDKPDHIWCAGGDFLPLRGYRTIHFGEGELDQGQCDTPRSVDYSPTCCTLIRASVFDKIGIMDERYFVYWDDTDFCYRAKQAGLVTWYDPGVKLWHKVSFLTGGSTSVFSMFYLTRNKVYFLLKNRPLWESIPLNLINWLFMIFCFILRPKQFEELLVRQKAFFSGVFLYVRQRKAVV